MFLICVLYFLLLPLFHFLIERKVVKYTELQMLLLLTLLSMVQSEEFNTLQTQENAIVSCSDLIV